MTSIILRIILALILCGIAASRLGELTGELSHGDQIRARVVFILILGAGLLFPAP